MTPDEESNAGWWQRSGQDPFALAALNGLVGDRLYAVTFILDYIQFQFDSHRINANSRLLVLDTEKELDVRDNDFRNALCRPIGKNVVGYRLTEEYLAIVFDETENRLCLADPDYPWPETAEIAAPGALLVFRSDRIFVFPVGK